MAWTAIIGQERVKELLRKAIARRSVAHAYLFHGQEGIGKDAIALEFAKALQCERGTDEACDACSSCAKAAKLRHPDIRIIVPLPTGKAEESGDDPIRTLDEDTVDIIREQLDAKAADPYNEITIPKAQFIKINSVRDLKRESSMSPVEGRYKVFVILRADAMNQESANSLLMTLEEPLENAVLLLTTAYRERLLATLQSRCQQLECSPLQESEICAALVERDGAETHVATDAARLADGSYRQARRLIGGDLAEERKEIVRFLRLVVAGKVLPLAAEIERLVSSYDRRQWEEWLSLLQTWLRDAMLLQTDPAHARLAADETLLSFSQRYPTARLQEAVATVDGAIADLRRNVYIPLILTTLSQQLRHLVVSSLRST